MVAVTATSQAPPFCWIDVSNGPETKDQYKQKRLHIARDRFRDRKRRQKEWNQAHTSSSETTSLDDKSSSNSPSSSQTTTTTITVSPKPQKHGHALDQVPPRSFKSMSKQVVKKVTHLPATDSSDNDDSKTSVVKSEPRVEANCSSFRILDHSPRLLDNVHSLLNSDLRHSRVEMYNLDPVRFTMAPKFTMGTFHSSSALQRFSFLTNYIESNSTACYTYGSIFCNNVMAAIYPIDSITMARFWWNNSMRLVPMMPMTLCIGALGIALSLPASNPMKEKLSQDAYKLRAVALAALAESLMDTSTSGSEANVLTVTAFHSIECISGELEAITAHFNGLVKILELCKSTDHFDHMTMSQLYLTDVCHGNNCKQPPKFPLDEKWLSEISALKLLDTLPELPDLHAMGVGFKDPAIASLLQPEALDILLQECRTITYTEFLKRKILKPREHDNDLYTILDWQVESLVYQIHSDEDDGSAQTQVQKCILHAILLFNISCLRKCAGFSFATMSLQELMKLLSSSSTLKYFDKPDKEELLLWLYWIGYNVCGYGQAQYYLWYKVMFEEAIEKLGLKTWRGVEAILNRFFYIDGCAVIIPDNLGQDAITK